MPCRPSTTPTSDWLMTAVGPPDWATTAFPLIGPLLEPAFMSVCSKKSWEWRAEPVAAFEAARDGAWYPIDGRLRLGANRGSVHSWACRHASTPRLPQSDPSGFRAGRSALRRLRQDPAPSASFRIPAAEYDQYFHAAKDVLRSTLRSRAGRCPGRRADHQAGVVGRLGHPGFSTRRRWSSQPTT